MPSTATSMHIKAKEPPSLPPNAPKASQSGKHPPGQATIGQRTGLLTKMDRLIDMHMTVVFSKSQGRGNRVDGIGISLVEAVALTLNRLSFSRCVGDTTCSMHLWVHLAHFVGP